MNLLKHRLAGVLASICLLAGCGAATQAPPPTASGVAATRPPAEANVCVNALAPLEQPIVAGFGGNVDLWQLKADGTPVSALTGLQPGTFILSPAWSPDGQTLVYSLVQASNDPLLPWLQTATLCGFDRATGQGRVLAAGTVAIIPSEISWTPDGSALLTTQRRLILDAKNQLQREETAVVRYDLAAGSQQTLLLESSSPAVAPDGKRFAYVKANPQTGFPSLMLAGIDASNPQPLGAPDPPFKGIGNLRWSPDGAQLVFSARGGPTVGEGAAPAERSWLGRLFGARSASAHGEPGSLWIIQADGTGLRPLLPAADDPIATWSPDGKTLLVSDWSDGLFTLDPASGETTFMNDNREFWALEWASH
jgi:Tol biopolymer transport system component